jgi:hypothetical protein
MWSRMHTATTNVPTADMPTTDVTTTSVSAATVTGREGRLGDEGKQTENAESEYESLHLRVSRKKSYSCVIADALISEMEAENNQLASKHQASGCHHSVTQGACTFNPHCS